MDSFIVFMYEACGIGSVSIYSSGTLRLHSVSVTTLLRQLHVTGDMAVSCQSADHLPSYLTCSASACHSPAAAFQVGRDMRLLAPTASPAPPVGSANSVPHGGCLYIYIFYLPAHYG